LYKRQMSEIPFKDHIRTDLQKLFVRIPNPEDFWFDGELYNHNISLQQIVAIANASKTMNEADQTLRYFVYDCFSPQFPDWKYSERLDILRRLFEKYGSDSPNITLLETVMIDAPDIKPLAEKYIRDGYEGLILRNSAGLYKYTRSADILKYKIENYEEFPIMDITLVPNRGAVFHLRTEFGDIFKVNGAGSFDYQQKVFTDRKKYIGKKIRIKFHGRTKDRIPKHANPVLQQDAFVFL